jgi:hypothetical protein
VHRKWEYFTLATDNVQHPEVARLGLEGWEAFAVNITKMPSTLHGAAKEIIIFFFKREILDASQN